MLVNKLGINIKRCWRKSFESIKYIHMYLHTVGIYSKQLGHEETLKVNLSNLIGSAGFRINTSVRFNLIA